jgi:hypothetical protein
VAHDRAQRDLRVVRVPVRDAASRAVQVEPHQVDATATSKEEKPPRLRP